MGKGKITGRVNEDGLYNVEIIYDTEYVDKQIEALGERVSVLSDSLTAAETALSEASDALAALKSAIDAETLNPPAPETPEAKTAAANLKLLPLKRAAVVSAEYQVGRLRLLIVAAEKDIEWLESVKPAPKNVSAWCADYSPNMPSGMEVGTIEINGETDKFQIRPNFEGVSGKEGYAEYKPGNDGIIIPAVCENPYSAYLNWALFPGWQKWMPTFRIGKITRIDYNANVADVSLEDAFSSDHDLQINQTDTLENVPVWYMSCNAAAFVVGDNVLIQFGWQDWNRPQIIGFKEDARPCAALKIKPTLNGIFGSYSMKTIKICRADGYVKYVGTTGDDGYANFIDVSVDDTDYVLVACPNLIRYYRPVTAEYFVNPEGDDALSAILANWHVEIRADLDTPPGTAWINLPILTPEDVGRKCYVHSHYESNRHISVVVETDKISYVLAGSYQEYFWDGLQWIENGPYDGNGHIRYLSVTETESVFDTHAVCPYLPDAGEKWRAVTLLCAHKESFLMPLDGPQWPDSAYRDYWVRSDATFGNAGIGDINGIPTYEFDVDVYSFQRGGEIASTPGMNSFFGKSHYPTNQLYSVPESQICFGQYMTSYTATPESNGMFINDEYGKNITFPGFSYTYDIADAGGDSGVSGDTVVYSIAKTVRAELV